MEKMEEKKKNLEPLLRASKEGDSATVRALLKGGNVDVNGVDKVRWTPLHYASLEGRLPVVELLLTAGADPNPANKYGSTPLHRASQYGHWQVVELLLKAGADPNAADEDGWTPLHHASLEGHLRVLELLLANTDLNAAAKEGSTSLHHASLEGHVQVVESLLGAGAQRNVAVMDGSTPLHHASLEGHLKVVELLLTADTDSKAMTKDGSTPLHHASLRGHLQVVESLLSADADPNLATKTRETPLHTACGSHFSAIACALLTHNADVHAKDNEEHEPLHFSLRRDEQSYDCSLAVETLDTLQVLVSFGATWDDKCDELVSSGKAWEEAHAIRICMSMWTQELADGLPFTKIPLEVIKRGADSTQAYIDDLKTSKEIVLRRKICLVGSSCAGKTSLVKSIISKQPEPEHVDDRTIGIDHFPLRFSESSTASDGKGKIHEVTFWDFAGQDAYQVAHSLFFSRRTLYLVCVDIGAFAIAYMQAVIFADHDFQETRLLDEFVEDSAMRWVRLIVARQPDAEFLFIATKEDTLADNQVTEELLKQSLMDKLKQVNTTAQQMKEPRENDKRLEDGSFLGLPTWLKKAGTTVQWMADQLKSESQGNTAHVSKVSVSVVTTEPTVVFVSCASLTSTQDARAKIEGLIIKSNYSFEMPDTYTRVLNEIVRMREAAKAKGIATRIAQVFAPVDSLPAMLNIEPAFCRSILQALHDLGDVLWYEDLDIAMFWETVILDPLLLIDFIREVFNHKNTGQILPHADLKAMHYWVGLDGDNKQMMAMKKVLQEFHLVYSADGYRVMEWDSDLIVPAFWQIKTPAAWKFLGDILRICRTQTHEGEAVRVHWEYDFKFDLPPPFFDHLVVASVSPGFEFDAGPDWIMHKEEEVAACRIMVNRDPRSLHRTIDVEAVVSETASAEQVEHFWGIFQLMSGAFVRVLREYPGLPVSSFAWTDTKCKRNMKDLLWSTSSRPYGKWMPPAETWGWFKCLATGQDRPQTIEDDWEGI